MDAVNYTWTWTSDLPLECVDHSVRIRQFSNQSVPSPWSDWRTNNGVQTQDRTRIFPYGRVLKEGSTAMFCCVAPRGVNITSMTFSNNKYPLINIGDGVKAIAVDNLTIPVYLIKAVTLRCNDATEWNYVSFPSQKPRNLSCATSDMTTVTCRWDSGRERDRYDRNKQTQSLYIQNTEQAPTRCERSSCTFSAVPHLEEYNIRLVVKDKLGEETESYSFNISERVFPVVEWDTVNPGVTDVTLSWIIQGNLTLLNLLCQVTTDPLSTKEVSCTDVGGICKVQLEQLLPNTVYSAVLRCSVSGRLRGEWTQSFTTHPLVTLDLWRTIKQLPDLNRRQVVLLWTPVVPGSAVTVNIPEYIVQWSEKGQNRTERRVVRQTQAEISVDSGQYDVSVEAVVHSGSTVPAHISIPERDNGENYEEKRLSSGAAAGFSLSWKAQDAATCDYVVEWCHVGVAAPCALRWIKVPQGRTTVSLPASNFTAGSRYTFNIYGCTKNGHMLLERQTGYSQELKFARSPVLVEPAQCTSSSVTLEWHYSEDDPAHPAFITGYLVTVQEAASGQTANLFNVSVADPHRKSLTIQHLQENQEYVISVSALTKEGPGQTASITIRTRTDYSAHLAKILIPILLLLCCILLLWPQRKMLKSGLKGIFVYPAGMNVKPPEFDGFLHEISERLQSQDVEECSSCDIEVLDVRSALNEPGPLNVLTSPPYPLLASSSSYVPLQADYRPQSVTVLQGRAASQQVACVTNRTYFGTAEKDESEPCPVLLSEVF
ncbi:uncharacterized protein V6R79_004825 [Siganus canaliculatus]